MPASLEEVSGDQAIIVSGAIAHSDDARLPPEKQFPNVGLTMLRKLNLFRAYCRRLQILSRRNTELEGALLCLTRLSPSPAAASPSHALRSPGLFG